MNNHLYTIGHSNHSIKRFVELLQQHKITTLADVRSFPYSRRYSHFNRECIQKTVQQASISYVFLGNELGARTKKPECYLNGKVQYSLLSKQPEFLNGLQRVETGMKCYNVAIMCSEKDPIECHRTILVGISLVERGIKLLHILADGTLESHADAEKRLVKHFKLPENDLFRTYEEILAEAYTLQAERIAYNQHKTAIEIESLK